MRSNEIKIHKRQEMDDGRAGQVGRDMLDTRTTCWERRERETALKEGTRPLEHTTSSKVSLSPFSNFHGDASPALLAPP
jgi:hypothetical protein